MSPRAASPAGEFKRWLSSRRDLDEPLDRWAFGVAGDDVIAIAPKDIAIVHWADLDNAIYQSKRYPGGQRMWAQSVELDEPVDISVSSPGAFVLEDGHHRYLAAKTLCKKLRAKIRITGKPIEVLLARAGR